MATAPSALRFAPGRSLRVDKPAAELYEDAVRRGEGIIAADGPLVVETAPHTGRSPRDKFIVREPSSEAHIGWGKLNKAMEQPQWDALTSGVDWAIVSLARPNALSGVGRFPMASWATVYEDEAIEILVRRNGRYAALAARR